MKGEELLMDRSDNGEGNCEWYKSGGVDGREIRSVTEAGVVRP